MKFIQLVMGPAGVGKSTYCKIMQEHCSNAKRVLHVANLDPASEYFDYEAAFDIRDLICLEDVMDELGYGPNGGLVYCMEYMLQNNEWLKEALDEFGEDEYIVLDCPGQIELYSHLPIMHNLAIQLTMWGYQVVSVYLIDALCVIEPTKFISGCLLSLSCMFQLGLPHINVVTKTDLVDKAEIESILDSESTALMLSSRMDAKYANLKLQRLTDAIGTVVDDYMMVSFAIMNRNDEESLDHVLYLTDTAVQYGENVEPKERDFLGPEGDYSDGEAEFEENA